MNDLRLVSYSLLLPMLILLVVDGRRTHRALGAADAPTRTQVANIAAWVALVVLIGPALFVDPALGIALTGVAACLAFPLSNAAWTARALTWLDRSPDSARVSAVLSFADAYRKMTHERDRRPERALALITPAIARLHALPPSSQTATIRAIVARGMADQAALLVRVGREDQALHVYREVASRYAGDSSAAVGQVVAECRDATDALAAEV
jgi:hypothetical protein